MVAFIFFAYKCDYAFWLGITFSAHPWVREGGNASEIPIDISVLSNMREFVKYSRLKQFALRVWFSLLDLSWKYG